MLSCVSIVDLFFDLNSINQPWIGLGMPQGRHQDVYLELAKEMTSQNHYGYGQSWKEVSVDVHVTECFCACVCLLDSKAIES